MDHQKGFIVGVCRRERPVEGSGDHFAVVDHGELVVQLVATGKAWGADALCLQWFCRICSVMLMSLMGP